MIIPETMNISLQFRILLKFSYQLNVSTNSFILLTNDDIVLNTKVYRTFKQIDCYVVRPGFGIKYLNCVVR